jgi:hypothetical protein
VRLQHFGGFGHDPDALADPWETRWRGLRPGGYYPTGKANVAWAETIAPHLVAGRNTSARFRYFCQGLGLLG